MNPGGRVLDVHEHVCIIKDKQKTGRKWLGGYSFKVNPGLVESKWEYKDGSWVCHF